MNYFYKIFTKIEHNSDGAQNPVEPYEYLTDSNCDTYFL